MKLYKESYQQWLNNPYFDEEAKKNYYQFKMTKK